MRRLSKEEELQWVSDLEKNINYPNNFNGDILLQYARDNFLWTKESTEYIEKKADDLIKYLAIGTGLLGYLINSSQLQGSVRLYLKWGFIFWVGAFFSAILARCIAFYRYPENIRYMFELLQKKGDHPNTLRTAMTISYEKARISHLHKGKTKSLFLFCSYLCLVGAAILFSASIIAAI